MLLLPLRRALVADPDPTRQIYVAEILKLLGAGAVETFADAACAGERAAAAGCDLIMVDWGGQGALPASVAAEARARGALIVAMGPSSLRGREAEAAARCGADLVLAGPFLRSGLFAALDGLLRGAAGRRLKVVELPARTASAPPPAALAPVRAAGSGLVRVTLSRGRRAG
jgi:DNA-binding response OmpR family regulator